MKIIIIAIIIAFTPLVLLSQEKKDSTKPKQEMFTRDHLFKFYTQEEVSRWVTTLNYCVFLRGYDGIANDGDRFLLELTFDSVPQLKQIEKALNLSIKESYYEKLSKGKSFASKSIGTYDFEGKIWFVYLNGNNNITFSPSNCKPFYVCEDDYLACVEIEKKINQKGLQDRVNMSIKKYDNAITKEKYSLYLK